MELRRRAKGYSAASFAQLVCKSFLEVEGVSIHSRKLLLRMRLCDTDRLLNRLILLLATTQLVLVDQHMCLFAFLLMFLDMLFKSCQDLSIERAVILPRYFLHLFQDVNREADRKRSSFFIHTSIVHLNRTYVKGGKIFVLSHAVCTAPSSPLQKGRTIHPPRYQDGGFLVRSL